MNTKPIVIEQKLPVTVPSVDPIATKVIAYLTRVGQLSAQNAADVQRIESKLDRLVELLESQSKRPALPAADSVQLIIDQSIEIYRTNANGKLYWHMRTTRYAKHGVALWPDPASLNALGITEDWLKSLPFDKPTTFNKRVTIALDKDGKKPKVISLA